MFLPLVAYLRAAVAVASAGLRLALDFFTALSTDRNDFSRITGCITVGNIFSIDEYFLFD